MSGKGKMYLLSQEEIDDLVEKCTQSGIDAFRQQEQQQRKRNERNSDHVRRMKEILSGYRRVKKVIRQEWRYSAQEQYEYRLKFLEDLMGDPISNQAGRTERMLLDNEEKHRRDQYSIKQIDTALALYCEECEASGNEEYRRRYRVLRAYYIDEPAAGIEDIADRENVSMKTVYRDLNIACGIMYQYVVGM